MGNFSAAREEAQNFAQNSQILPQAEERNRKGTGNSEKIGLTVPESVAWLNLNRN
jgi:hypothetical protein